jgi:hypothetical protein
LFCLVLALLVLSCFGSACLFLSALSQVPPTPSPLQQPVQHPSQHGRHQRGQMSFEKVCFCLALSCFALFCFVLSWLVLSSLPCLKSPHPTP